MAFTRLTRYAAGYWLLLNAVQANKDIWDCYQPPSMDPYGRTADRASAQLTHCEHRDNTIVACYISPHNDDCQPFCDPWPLHGSDVGKFCHGVDSVQIANGTFAIDNHSRRNPQYVFADTPGVRITACQKDPHWDRTYACFKSDNVLEFCEDHLLDLDEKARYCGRDSKQQLNDHELHNLRTPNVILERMDVKVDRCLTFIMDSGVSETRACYKGAHFEEWCEGLDLNTEQVKKFCPEGKAEASHTSTSTSTLPSSTPTSVAPYSNGTEIKSINYTMPATNVTRIQKLRPRALLGIYLIAETFANTVRPPSNTSALDPHYQYLPDDNSTEIARIYYSGIQAMDLDDKLGRPIKLYDTTTFTKEHYANASEIPTNILFNWLSTLWADIHLPGMEMWRRGPVIPSDLYFPIPANFSDPMVLGIKYPHMANSNSTIQGNMSTTSSSLTLSATPGLHFRDSAARSFDSLSDSDPESGSCSGLCCSECCSGSCGGGDQGSGSPWGSNPGSVTGPGRDGPDPGTESGPDSGLPSPNRDDEGGLHNYRSPDDMWTPEPQGPPATPFWYPNSGIPSSPPQLPEGLPPWTDPTPPGSPAIEIPPEVAAFKQAMFQSKKGRLIDARGAHALIESVSKMAPPDVTSGPIDTQVSKYPVVSDVTYNRSPRCDTCGKRWDMHALKATNPDLWYSHYFMPNDQNWDAMPKEMQFTFYMASAAYLTSVNRAKSVTTNEWEQYMMRILYQILSGLDSHTGFKPIPLTKWNSDGTASPYKPTEHIPEVHLRQWLDQYAVQAISAPGMRELWRRGRPMRCRPLWDLYDVVMGLEDYGRNMRLTDTRDLFESLQSSFDWMDHEAKVGRDPFSKTRYDRVPVLDIANPLLKGIPARVRDIEGSVPQPGLQIASLGIVETASWPLGLESPVLPTMEMIENSIITPGGVVPLLSRNPLLGEVKNTVPMGLMRYTSQGWAPLDIIPKGMPDLEIGKRYLDTSFAKFHGLKLPHSSWWGRHGADVISVGVAAATLGAFGGIFGGLFAHHHRHHHDHKGGDSSPPPPVISTVSLPPGRTTVTATGDMVVIQTNAHQVWHTITAPAENTSHTITDTLAPYTSSSWSDEATSSSSTPKPTSASTTPSNSVSVSVSTSRITTSNGNGAPTTIAVPIPIPTGPSTATSTSGASTTQSSSSSSTSASSSSSSSSLNSTSSSTSAQYQNTTLSISAPEPTHQVPTILPPIGASTSHSLPFVTIRPTMTAPPPHTQTPQPTMTAPPPHTPSPLPTMTASASPLSSKQYLSIMTAYPASPTILPEISTALNPTLSEIWSGSGIDKSLFSGDVAATLVPVTDHGFGSVGSTFSTVYAAPSAAMTGLSTSAVGLYNTIG